MTAGFIPAFFLSCLSFIQIKFLILFQIFIVILTIILIRPDNEIPIGMAIVFNHL